MSSKYDVIIVGAGHNGLVCANVLSKKGYKVLMLEANKSVGGLVVEHEFSPGYKVSACAHLLYGLHPKVAKACNLNESTLEFVSANISTLLVNQHKEYVTISSGESSKILYSSTVSEHESMRWETFMENMSVLSGILYELADKIPPRLKNGSLKDYKTLFNAGLKLRRLEKTQQREFLRIIGMNIYDLVDENLNDKILQAGLCFESVLGTRLGPRAPNTVYNWLNRRAIMNQNPNGMCVPRGGLGNLTQALCNNAIDQGVDISVSSRVAKILISNNQVNGVELSNGDKFSADKVISNADLKSTMMSLVGPENLDTDVVRRVMHVPMQGHCAKMHIALDGLPESVTGNLSDFCSRIICASSPDHVERASNAIKYNEYTDKPVFEITVPSMLDKPAPANGKHVMSVINPYVPYQHKNGWHKEKPKFENHMLESIERLFPGTLAAMVDVETLTPADIEQQFNVTGGHWHHGEIGLERFLMLRPVPGFAQYSSPITGLFLCGADCHPGGDVTGVAGMNAAQAVINKK